MTSGEKAEPIKYKQVVVTRHGSPEVLQVVEEPLPEPGAGEVRVKVLAAGVSAFDLIYRRWGRLPGSPPLPFALGEDIVGTVDKLGEGVSDIELGQMVAGGTWSLGVGGGYTEFICLPSTELVPVPMGADPVEVVCLVANYLTAHLHMHRIARVRSGERVLIHGAAGGVGTALLELGKIAKLEMYGTASRHNHDLVSALGATPIDYRGEDFVASIRTLTVDGVDLVIDTVGGASLLWHSYQVLRKGGRLVWLGSAATRDKGFMVGPLSLLMVFVLKLIPDSKHVPMCPDLGKFAETHNDWYHETLTELFDLLTEGKIKPVVAERIPLVEATRAHKLLEKGGYAGKVVLVTSP